MNAKDDYLIELLQDQGLVSAEQIQQGREELASKGLVDFLVSKGLITSRDVTIAKAVHFGEKFIDLRTTKIDTDALALVSPEQAWCWRVIPLSGEPGHVLTVAMSDPSDLETRDILVHVLNALISVRVAMEEDIVAALEKYYAAGKVKGEQMREEMLYDKAGLQIT